MGSTSRATGDNSSAFGITAQADGQFSSAIGRGAFAFSNSATAVGSFSTATGTASTAIGAGAQATADNSVAIGQGSVASEANTISIGDVGAERRITNVATGVSGTDAVNVDQLNSATGALVDDVSNLQSNANAEANARIAADAQLTEQYQTVAQDLTTEQSQRMVADAALDTRVSTLESSMANIDERFSHLDNRIAAGTAVATAMSGNAFLPDMKFNLTANAATYDGAHAAAIQMGAMVSRHTAVNAGIAKGFNRGGKTAGRVGFTVGW